MPDADAFPTLDPLPVRVQRAARSAVTARTIAALVLREMSTRFGRKPGGYVWAILQPLGIILMLSIAYSLLVSSPPLGASFILFKATGLLIFQLFSGTVKLVGKSLAYSRPLLTYPGVTWVDAVIARFLLNVLVSLVVMVVILTGVVIYEGEHLNLNWAMILGSVALTALLAFGIGVFNAFMAERFDIYDNIWGILTAPLMIASGVIFLYDDLPSFAQEILWYNPLVHTVGMMRVGFYAVYHPQYISIIMVLLSSMIPMVLGLILLRRYHRELLNR